MPIRILLTGSNGLLGHKIIPLLLENPEIEFLATARGENRHPQAGSFAYQPLDLTDTEAVGNVLAEFQPEVIINTAAHTQVDFCEDNQEECDAINVVAVRELANACAELGIRLVHISTDFVFDGADGPYREGDEPNPPNYYGLSKLKGEEAIIESGADYAILRTILLYGIAPAMSRSNIVLWAKKTLAAGKNVNAVNDQWRTPTLVEDLAIASVEAALRSVKGIYHIGGPEMMRIDDIVRRVARFWNLDENLISEIDSTSLNQRAKRPAKTGFVIDKAVADLDYQPRSFEEGLALVDEQMKTLALEG